MLKLWRCAPSPKVLEIPNEITSGVLLHPHSTASRFEVYSLCAIIFHSGPSLHSGHYVVWARRGEHYYEFDDSTVTQLSEDRLRRRVPLALPHSEIPFGPYLIWYELQQPLAPPQPPPLPGQDAEGLGLMGLKNSSGQACFAATVLQALMSLPIIRGVARDGRDLVTDEVQRAQFPSTALLSRVYRTNYGIALGKEEPAQGCQNAA